jgi:hypothetical protein
MSMHVSDEILVSHFLREKLTNMVAWLTDAGFGDVMRRDVLKVQHLHDIQITALCQALNERFAETIEARDWEHLTIDDKENVPEVFVQALTFVRDRPDLHDKFWRYLQLFSDTVSSS